RESEGTVCSSELYLYYRESFCRNRNGVHPIFKYGYRTGLSMVRELEQNLRRRQNRSLTDSDSSYFSQILSAPSGQTQALLRRKREVSQSVLRRHYCYSDEAIRREPNWRQKCCCGSCSRLFFIVQCRHPYESVPSGSCDLHWERLPLRLTD
uniref:DBF4-type domain-containing protein n=1 Tax=Macrostomum lignano TaxID=282301 RepID=A0A1I8I027_9PLAT